MRDADYRKKLIEYIQRNLKKGYTLESLRWALVNQGYSRTDISRAIEEVHKELAKKAPILKEKPVIKHHIIDENDKLVIIKKPFWKRLLSM